MTNLSLLQSALAARVARAGDRLRAPIALRLAAARAQPAQLVRDYEPLQLGDSSASETLLAGRAIFAGMEAKVDPADIWSAAPPSSRWAGDLHSFEGLAECAVLGGEEEARGCRQATRQWLQKHRRWRPVPWRPDVASRRLRSWLSYPQLPATQDDGHHGDWCAALSIHADYLDRRRASAPEGVSRLETAAGLIAAGLCLAGKAPLAGRGIDMMLAEIDGQISPGGAHVSRNPADLLRALELLVESRRNLALADSSRAKAFDDAIGRISPALRLLRHGDGGLAAFHGAPAVTDGRVDRALVEARVRAKAPDQVGGFARLSSGRTAVVIDVGRAPQGQARATAHASALAFEMSHGRRRIIVNCGAAERLQDAWRMASRSTPAHSTLVVGDASSASFLSKGFAAKALGPWIMDGPGAPDVERAEDVEGAWISVSHDGYAAPFGLTHQRRLFLSPDGYDLRGEDTLATFSDEHRQTLTEVQPAGGMPFAIRFHLHPQIEAQVNDRGVVRLSQAATFGRCASRAGI
jgi:uncharacterized heparinase superfamily protein